MSDERIVESEQQVTIVGTVSDQARVRGRRDIVERSVDVSKLKDRFNNFVESLRGILDVEVPALGNFELSEIQFSAEISANGEFKLLGTGVGLEASSGVTFTLRRTRESDGDSSSTRPN